MPESGSSRRTFIKTMCVFAAAATGGPTTAADAQEYKAQEQKKLTQPAARYQDHPNGNDACGACPYFAVSKELCFGRGRYQPDGLVPNVYELFSTRSRRPPVGSISSIRMRICARRFNRSDSLLSAPPPTTGRCRARAYVMASRCQRLDMDNLPVLLAFGPHAGEHVRV